MRRIRQIFFRAGRFSDRGWAMLLAGSLILSILLYAFLSWKTVRPIQLFLTGRIVFAGLRFLDWKRR
jgi:hypothetical protein